MSRKSLFSLLFVFTLFTGLLIGCSNETASSKKDDDTTKKDSDEGAVEAFTIDEPVTLKMINWWPEETWIKWWKEPVEKKFPNVTLEQIPIQPEPNSLDEIFAAKEVPDLFVGHDAHVRNLLEYETALDMRGLIDKHGFDTEKFLPGLMEQVENFSSGGEVYMLPFWADRYVLHYNKDIFDKFGVPYPTDNMSYKEVLELARKVTGERDGTNYYGLQWQWDSFNTVGAHIRVLDNETLEPRFTSDNQWSEFFSLIQEMYNIHGNLPEEEAYQSYVWDRFEGEENVAMVPLWFNQGLMNSEMNWDMVTYPSWDGFEDQVPGGVGFGMGVTALSEHPDAAFQVLAYLLSEEAVAERYNDGFSTSQLIYDPSDLQVELDPNAEKVNYNALFKKSYLPKNKHPFEDQVFSATVIDQMSKLLYSGTDINTHLRELTDLANVTVEDLKAQQP